MQNKEERLWFILNVCLYLKILVCRVYEFTYERHLIKHVSVDYVG